MSSNADLQEVRECLLAIHCFVHDVTYHYDDAVPRRYNLRPLPHHIFNGAGGYMVKVSYALPALSLRRKFLPTVPCPNATQWSVSSTAVQ